MKNRRSLAPQYDLVSTIAWPRLSNNLAMTIGNNKSVNVFGMGEWKNMSISSNLGWPMVKKRIMDISNLVIEKAKDIQISLNMKNDVRVNSLSNIIESRAKRMLDALSSQNI